MDYSIKNDYAIRRANLENYNTIGYNLDMSHREPYHSGTYIS